MRFLKKFSWLILALVPAVYAATPPPNLDYGDNNKPYQKCFNDCTKNITCYENDGGNVKSLSFSYQAACHNKQLECQFACKDKYNVQ